MQVNLVNIEWDMVPGFTGWAMPAHEGGKELISVGGALLGLKAIRVHDVDTIQVAFDDGVSNDLEAVQELAGGRAQTTRLVGFEGQWVVYAHPLGD